MTQSEFLEIESDFLERVERTRLEAYAATGYEWMVVPKTGANRSIAEQHKLYMRNRNGVDDDGDGKIDEADEKVTNADGGTSPHNYNLARDICPCNKPGHIWWDAPTYLWHKMGEIAERNGLTWGGNFRTIYDAPHIESREWRKVMTAWKKGELIFG